MESLASIAENFWEQSAMQRVRTENQELAFPGTNLCHARLCQAPSNVSAKRQVASPRVLTGGH